MGDKKLPRLDERNQCICRGDRRIDLPEKVYQVLRYLLSQPNQLVKKDELLDAVWPGTHVIDAVLSVAVSQLRDALDDDPRQPRFIATVHGRGYRWIGPPLATTVPVAPISATEELPSEPSAPLLGRETSMAQLQQALARADSGRRQIEFITGEAGIGKTTLVDEFIKLALVRPTPTRVARGQCVDGYGVEEVYLPLMEALECLCRDDAEVVAALRKCAPTWLVRLPGLLPAAEEEELRQSLAASGSERNAIELQRALASITTARTLILVLEDLHWSDPGTVALLATIANRREPARLLVLATYRPADAIAHLHPIIRLNRELASKRLCREIELAGLDADAVHAYLGLRFPDNDFPPELHVHLQRQTAGNPLFLINALDDFEQRTWLQPSDGLWRCTVGLDQIDAAVPEGTRAMIDARFAWLADVTLELLEAASVIGTAFTSQTLAAVAQRDQAEVEEVCIRLARDTQFLRRNAPPVGGDHNFAAHFEFRHALYRQVLDLRLSPARRQRLHGRIADSLQQTYGDDVTEVVVPLAVHCEQAGDFAGAVKYRRLAARVAARCCDYTLELDHLHRALQSLQRLAPSATRDDRELSLQMALIPALLFRLPIESPAVEAAAKRVTELSAHAETTPKLLQSLVALFNLENVRCRLPSARSAAERLIDRAAAVPWGEPFLLLGKTLLGFVQLVQGAISSALPNLECGFDSAIIPIDAAGFARSDASVTHALLGSPERALRLGREMFDHGAALKLPRALAYAASSLLRLGVMLGDRTAVEDSTRALATVMAENTSRRWAGFVKIGEGWLRVEAGDPGGVDLIVSGHHLQREYTRTHQSFNASTAIAALLQFGRDREAEALLAQTWAIIAESDDHWCDAELHRLEGELKLIRRRAPEDDFRRALQVAETQGARWWQLRAAVALARWLRRDGRTREAEDLLRPMLDSFEEGFDLPDLRAAMLSPAGKDNRRARRAPHPR